MRIAFDNCDFGSSSGPNNFGRLLAAELMQTGHVIDDANADAQLSFIAATKKVAPIVQRVDGIYFNTAQDWNALNTPIFRTYRQSEVIIAQSSFNKELIERYFGGHGDIRVIRNGTNLSEIESQAPLDAPQLDEFEDVWCCASTWRPHKRLSENIRYFLEFAPEKACLIVAGDSPDAQVAHPRVFYAGKVERPVLLSLYRRSSHFLHLAWLDHCPNVVVDARASGCRIVCSSSGGTKEIAGRNAVVIEEDDWDWEPLSLYEPPRMDFARTCSVGRDSELDIRVVAEQYVEAFESVKGSK